MGGQIADREGVGVSTGGRGRKRERDIRGWFGVGKRRREGDEGEDIGGGKGAVCAKERVRDDGGALCFDEKDQEEEKDRSGNAATVTSTGTTADIPMLALDESTFDDDDISDSDLLLLDPSNSSTTTPVFKPLFTSLTIYISGPTTPLITDHRLKHLLIRHGAEIAFSLARRRVTHVILGKSNNAPSGDRLGGEKGSGGGLAAGKLQREIRRVAGEGVRFVRVEWYVSVLIFLLVSWWFEDCGVC